MSNVTARVAAAITGALLVAAIGGTAATTQAGPSTSRVRTTTDGATWAGATWANTPVNVPSKRS